MRRLMNVFLFLAMYGGALALIFLLQKVKQTTTNFALEAILFLLIYGIGFYLIFIPFAIWFNLWPKIKRALFEKWKREYEEQDQD
jgi:hypothetical protein